jgi:hypothetical protein
MSATAVPKYRETCYGKGHASLPGKNFQRATFESCTFSNLDGSGVDFSGSNFSGLVFEGQIKFCGANLTDVKCLANVKGLDKASLIFDDDTVVDGIDLEEVAKKGNVDIAAKLRAVRKISQLKRKHRYTYRILQSLCACGREPLRLVWWMVGVVVGFGFFYGGGAQSQGGILPHLIMSEGEATSPLTLPQCFGFSAMTLLNFNKPNVIWWDTVTDIWVTTEIGIGFIFLGVFVSLLATWLLQDK